MTGPEIKAIRKAAGLKQREFAQRIGAQPLAVSRWENGHVSPLPVFEQAIRAFADSNEQVRQTTTQHAGSQTS